MKTTDRFYYEAEQVVSPALGWVVTRKVLYTPEEFWRAWRARERSQAMMSYALLHDDDVTVAALTNEFDVN